MELGRSGAEKVCVGVGAGDEKGWGELELGRAVDGKIWGKLNVGIGSGESLGWIWVRVRVGEI